MKPVQINLKYYQIFIIAFGVSLILFVSLGPEYALFPGWHTKILAVDSVESIVIFSVLFIEGLLYYLLDKNNRRIIKLLYLIHFFFTYLPLALVIHPDLERILNEKAGIEFVDIFFLKITGFAIGQICFVLILILALLRKRKRRYITL